MFTLHCFHRHFLKANTTHSHTYYYVKFRRVTFLIVSTLEICFLFPSSGSTKCTFHFIATYLIEFHHQNSSTMRFFCVSLITVYNTCRISSSTWNKTPSNFFLKCSFSSYFLFQFKLMFIETSLSLPLYLYVCFGILSNYCFSWQILWTIWLNSTEKNELKSDTTNTNR